MSALEKINGVDVYRAEPDVEIRGGLILIHEIWGLVEHIKDVADRYAREGYMVLAPDLLSGVGITPAIGEELSALNAEKDPEKVTAQQPVMRERMAPAQAPEFAAAAIKTLKATVDVLAADPRVGARIGVTGFCFGGAYAFSLAAADDRIKVSVPFYGTAPAPEKIAQIKCPVFAFYGEDDPRIMDPLPEARKNLAAAGVDYADHVYPGTLHAFFNDTNERTYDADAAADAWRRSLEFIGRRMDA